MEKLIENLKREMKKEYESEGSFPAAELVLSSFEKFRRVEIVPLLGRFEVLVNHEMKTAVCKSIVTKSGK